MTIFVCAALSAIVCLLVYVAFLLERLLHVTRLARLDNVMNVQHVRTSMNVQNGAADIEAAMQRVRRRSGLQWAGR